MLDPALADARRLGVDLVLANDPDADRLAVAVPWAGFGGEDGWRRLTGDEVGALLADALLRGVAPAGVSGGAPLIVSTVVSGSLVGRIARAADARFELTLTGFKWIMHAAGDAAARDGSRLLLGCEQALGYGITDAVRDKDGVSAGLAMAAIVATARARGESVQDRLDALACRFGLHATAERDLPLTAAGAAGGSDPRAALRTLGETPPAALLGEPVTAIDDLATGVRIGRDGTRTPLGLPSSTGVILHGGDRVRLAVRPSGTEPKMKLYLQVVVDVLGGDVDAARRQAAARLDALGTEAEELMGR